VAGRSEVTPSCVRGAYRVFELFPEREHARLEVVDGLRVLDDELVLGLRGSTQLGEHAL